LKRQLESLINENYQIRRVLSKKIELMDGTSINVAEIDSALHSLLIEKLKGEDLNQYTRLDPNSKRTELVKVFQTIAHRQKDERDQERLESEYEAQAEEHGIDLSKLIVLCDTYDDRALTFLYDVEEEKLSEFSYKAVKEFLVNDKLLHSLPRRPVKVFYDPMSTPNYLSTESIDGQQVSKINIYKEPSWLETCLEKFNFESPSFFIWRKNMKEVQRTDLPPLARRFFEHLFPDRLSREYAYSFIFDALTSRNGSEYILVLSGPTGTGKTIFAEKLMKRLVGASNWAAASKNLFKSTFNGVLENKRLIHVDEARVSQDTYSTVKLYANKVMNIERKGIDAENTTELFLSFVITNNVVGQYYIHYDDRRNSVLEITNKKLLNEWDKTEVDEFIKLLNDEDFIYEIGEFILTRSWQKDKERSKDFSIEQFRGDKFYKFVQRHLSSWQKLLLRLVMTKGRRGETEITLDEVIRKMENDGRRKTVPQEDTIIEFINAYRHLNQYGLGVVKTRYDDEDGLAVNTIEIDDYFIVNETNEQSGSDDEEEEDIL